MAKLQFLSAYVTERLMAAAQDIIQMLEKSIADYEQESAHYRMENQQLRIRLQEIGHKATSILLETSNPVMPISTTRASVESPQEHNLHVVQLHDNLEAPLEVKQEQPEPPHTPLSSFPSPTVLENEELTQAGAVPHQTTAEFLGQTDMALGEGSDLELHAGDRHYICTVCSKGFSSLKALKLHKRMHLGRVFYCSMCGKCFTSLGKLKQHQRVHTGEKPYSCSICSRSFSQSSHLKVHLRVHTGEKPYSCPVCDRRFRQSCQIKGHLLTHTR